MPRRRHNLLTGTLGAALGGLSTDTSITFSAALQDATGANIATLASNDTIILTIDNEVVELTAYTAGATTGTITRGVESSTIVSHANGAAFFSPITAEDAVWFAGAQQLPATITNSTLYNDAAYRIGYRYWKRVLSADGWPVSGLLLGCRTSSTRHVQMLQGEFTPNLYFRFYTGAGWSVWYETLHTGGIGKGGIWAGTAADTAAVLAVGADNRVLTADSTQTTGLRWAAAPVYVKKTADQAVTSTSFVSDTELTFTPAASTDYHIELFIIWQSVATTTGARFAVLLPTAGVDLAWFRGAQQVTASATASTDMFSEAMIAASDNDIVTATAAAEQATNQLAVIEGVLSCGSGVTGPFALRIQSEVASSAITVKAKSFLIYRAY